MRPRSLLTLVCVLALTTFGLSNSRAQDQSLSLAGRWRFQLDRGDLGVDQAWFARSLPESLKLPGGLTEQGIGDPVSVNTKWIGDIVDKSWFNSPHYAKYREPGNVKVPFWLQPDLYYAGAAWFQRDVEIPAKWTGGRIVLFLERPHWETRVWVDGKFMGTNNALATPHEYDLGRLAPGRHTLTIRVDNRLVVDVGQNSHSVSDHTQGNWNGIVGRIELRFTPLVWIEDVKVFPNVARKTALVKVRIGNATGTTGQGVITSQVRSLNSQVKKDVLWGAEGGACELELDLGGKAQAWDEFNPVLYDLVTTLTPNSEEKAEASRFSTRFGLREIGSEGTQFVLNGRKVFFRGTLECCIFPKTGHPPTDVASWKHIIRAAKGHGLNMIRFHSWCPPEAAFVAADEFGFYFHVECSSWANQSTTLGDGKPVDAWIYAEAERILKHYGNHPSFVLMLCGNEPGGKNHHSYLREWVARFVAEDPRRLYSGGAGWPEIAPNQFNVRPDPRVQGWGQGVGSRVNSKPPETVTDYTDFIIKRTRPVISHEIGQWCVYPNFDEIKKYTGYLKPKNFEIFRDRLQANGMGNLAKAFLIASGKLQALCYKEEIESALRTPGMGGFQLLDLHDFPGQGTALVGVLDPFWEEKGYITPREYSRFCNSTVPLARLPRRVFTQADKLTASIEVTHYGPAPLASAVVEWKLVQTGGKELAAGSFPAQTIPIGSANKVGDVAIALSGVKAPSQCKLVVKLHGKSVTPVFEPAGRLESRRYENGRLESRRYENGRLESRRYENDWDVWVYPEQPVADAADVLVTSQFDDAARDRLAAGGNVLLTIPGKQVRNYDKHPFKLGFSSIFWNTAWTARQAPTTLGILCDPRHPALAQFPTEPYSNWQWWYLIHRAGALRLDLLPPGTKPVVRIIDDWVTAYPLGLIVEGRVGKGRIVICGFDLTHHADDPVSRQMRTSLVQYLGSRECNPRVEFSTDQVRSLIVEGQSRGVSLRSAKADSEQVGFEAARAIDVAATFLLRWFPSPQ